MKPCLPMVAVCAAWMTAVLPQSFAQQATADKPAMCWDYNTLAESVGSRFGLKGAADDTILSRTGYYTLTKLPVKLSAPMSGGTQSWFKVELKAEAEGGSAALTLSGMLVELDNVSVDNSFRNLKFETHVDGDGRLHHLRLVALEARFKAGGETISVPFRSQGPDLARQDFVIRLGSFPSPTRPTGGSVAFDPKATLPVMEQIDSAWKKAGTMTIEFILPETGAVVATSQALPYAGDKAAAEFMRMNGRAGEMISGGKCQYLAD